MKAVLHLLKIFTKYKINSWTWSKAISSGDSILTVANNLTYYLTLITKSLKHYYVKHCNLLKLQRKEKAIISTAIESAKEVIKNTGSPMAL